MTTALIVYSAEEQRCIKLDMAGTSLSLHYCRNASCQFIRFEVLVDRALKQLQELH